MADTAAHLVDRVLPEVPIRQWVLSLPFALRYRLAYDARLVRDVLQILVPAIFASHRRRARLRGASPDIKCGAVTFVQRFGDALNLNVYFHMLVLDGTYEANGGGILFRPLPPPGDAELARVAARVACRVTVLLEGRGLGRQADPKEADPLRRDQPLLAELYGASASGPPAGHCWEGKRLAGFCFRPDCASVSGFNLHAGVCIPAHDRMRLERLCRYAGRPPVGLERLSLLPDGRLLYRLKRRWRNGTMHVVFDRAEFVEKLAALVPPPRFNLIRYHGVLAPASRWRALVVPSVQGDEEDTASHPGCPAGADRQDAHAGRSASPQSNFRRAPHPRNYSWAELMHRVFLVDVLDVSIAAAVCGLSLQSIRVNRSERSSLAWAFHPDLRRWAVTFERQGNAIKMTYKGKITGNEIKFTRTREGSDQAQEFTAKRATT
jgi:hypothetical protein